MLLSWAKSLLRVFFFLCFLAVVFPVRHSGTQTRACSYVPAERYVGRQRARKHSELTKRLTHKRNFLLAKTLLSKSSPKWWNPGPEKIQAAKWIGKMPCHLSTIDWCSIFFPSFFLSFFSHYFRLQMTTTLSVRFFHRLVKAKLQSNLWFLRRNVQPKPSAASPQMRYKWSRYVWAASTDSEWARWRVWVNESNQEKWRETSRVKRREKENKINMWMLK